MSGSDDYIDAQGFRANVGIILMRDDRDWFTRDTFMAMLRLRGLECRAPSGYVAAYHGRKLQFRS